MVIGITDLSNGSHHLKIQLNSEFPLDDIGSHIIRGKKDGGKTSIYNTTSFEANYDDDYSISIPFYNNKK